jgi:hypothetical protein
MVPVSVLMCEGAVGRVFDCVCVCVLVSVCEEEETGAGRMG